MASTNSLAPSSSIVSKDSDLHEEKAAYNPDLNRIIEADELVDGDDAGQMMKGQRLDFTEEEGNPLLSLVTKVVSPLTHRETRSAQDRLETHAFDGCLLRTTIRRQSCSWKCSGFWSQA